MGVEPVNLDSFEPRDAVVILSGCSSHEGSSQARGVQSAGPDRLFQAMSILEHKPAIS